MGRPLLFLEHHQASLVVRKKPGPHALFFQVISVLMSCVLVAGCVLGPDYERPNLETPANYRSATQSSEDSLFLSELGWWELFHDENLHALIRKGLLENKDLRLAIARLREARAQLGVTRADQFPQLEGRTDFQRNQTSGAQAKKFGIEGGDVRPGPHTSQWRATGDLKFEIDLWGKLRRATEAGRADLLAQEWAQRSTRLSLVSDIVQAYFELQELDLERTISLRTLVTRQKTLELITLRKLMGQSSMLDIDVLNKRWRGHRLSFPVWNAKSGKKNINSVSS